MGNGAASIQLSCVVQPLNYRSPKTSKSKTQRRTPRGLFFESLEIRRVLDASALLSPAGTVSIEGTEDADRIVAGDDTDVLTGGTGEDYFDGGAARDYIFARDGFVDLLCIDELDFVLKDDIDLLVCEL